jgi:hypothetical protein
MKEIIIDKMAIASGKLKFSEKNLPHTTLTTKNLTRLPWDCTTGPPWRDVD